MGRLIQMEVYKRKGKMEVCEQARECEGEELTEDLIEMAYQSLCSIESQVNSLIRERDDAVLKLQIIKADRDRLKGIVDRFEGFVKGQIAIKK